MAAKYHLTVAERFYSLQGEGQTMGVPAVFLRLAGCNLLCDGAWLCDTIEVWKKGERMDFNSVLLGTDYFGRLHRGAHLVITGGEPLLQQAALTNFLKWFEQNYNWLPTIEVETNGTVMPNEYLLNRVSYWNVSPKLSNSGEPAAKRIKPDVLSRLTRENAIFKFVLGTDADTDVTELVNDFSAFVDMDKVYLMPAGESQEALAVTRPIVAALAIRLGLHYSDRLHIAIWNQKTGV